jgi:uncharacterized protein with GYD domain
MVRCAADKIREGSVPTYIMLANWTDRGAQKVQDSPRRLETAKKALVDMGGDFKSVYMTMGEYDLIAVYEAPDDAVSARFTLLLGSLGSVRTKTLKAFPEAAYREIIASLG